MMLARRIDVLFDRYIPEVCKTGACIKIKAGESHQNGAIQDTKMLINIDLSDKHTYLGFNYI